MPDLIIFSTSKLCVTSFRWVYVAAAVTITFCALFRSVPQSSFYVPLPIAARQVFNDPVSEISIDSRSEEILFEEFGAIRRTISEIITMVASSNNTLQRKIEFLNLGTNFIRERLLLLLQTNEQFLQVSSNFFLVENSFDALKTNMTKTRNKDLKLFDYYLQNYLKDVGNWLEEFTETYEQIMKKKNDECSRELIELEQIISRQIYETQHGEICEKSTTVLLLRETTTYRFLVGK